MASLLTTGALGSGAVHPASAQDKAAANSGVNVDWPRIGNDSNNTRYSTLTQINPSNVSKLGYAWTLQEGTNLTTFEDFPVVVDGVLYMTTNLDQVRALDAATGKLIWQYTPKVNFYEAIAGGGGGIPTNRGVEVANGRVYLLTFDDQLISLQAATGEELWSSQVADPAEGYSETSPPTYYNGLLIVGSAESDAGLRGFVAAFDANTGKQVWRFYTVPDVGQGWMPKTGAHGGGDVWMPQVVDTTTGIVYFGTGNPSPDFDNRQRPGCNPWVDATVALNAMTGKFIWAHTEVCPDVWDYDSMPSPAIFDVNINGKTVHAVGHANKSGAYFIYDAATGKVLAQSPHLAYYTTPHLFPSVKGSYVCPGANGGIEYDPQAFSPITQEVYVSGMNECMTFTLGNAAQEALHVRGAIDIGGGIIFGNNKNKPDGFVVALNAATGKIAWKDTFPSPSYSGTMVTASGLVFAGANDGLFRAMDATTGNVLWSANVGLGFGAPPITYMVDGVQYIAIAAGGANNASFVGATVPPGGTMVVFKLNGSPIHKIPGVNTGDVPTAVERPSTAGMTKINPYMYANPTIKHVVIMITAAATSTNNGFNFDGYANGKANFIVPAGWAVDWIFTNKSPIPHIAQLKPGSPAVGFGFATAGTANPTAGIPAGKEQYVSFNTILTGKYYLACLVPGHLQSGMWDNFTISTTATMPSIATS
jgi:PQQ-dependent dehydrogenase (methanol/ethanol family)